MMFRSVEIMRSIKIMSKVVARAALALLLGSPVIVFAQQAHENATPAASLKAAWAKLGAFKSYRERRVYEIPMRSVQIVEWSGALQHWITLGPQGSVVNETIWDKGRSASRQPPDTTWSCNPQIPDEATDPPSVVRDGGAQEVNGRSASRFVEEFMNPMTGAKVVCEVDVDAATGVPIRLFKTETLGDYVEKYVGTYYDLGAAIVLVFPSCR
jgi:hypothetical protein